MKHETSFYQKIALYRTQDKVQFSVCNLIHNHEKLEQKNLITKSLTIA